MESAATFFTVLFVVGAPLFFIGYVVFVNSRYFYWYHIRSIEPEKKIILQKYFLYYRRLPHNQKKRFENRVALFIRSKDWYGQDGLEITQEMKVLVAATAVQITFGFAIYQLPQFTKIFIYPKEYYNEQTKNYHKGEVSPMGKIIKLSWNNFLKGYNDPKDGINLGLHEMTHAMSLENRFTKNGVSNFISPRARAHWRKLAIEEIHHIKTKGDSLFREYAATNLEEFLAVTVEVFFEQPNEFNKYHSRLFRATCDLLNQYPV
jgi:Mlc titration factor MtfA (ptsG expression regulator)